MAGFQLRMICSLVGIVLGVTALTGCTTGGDLSGTAGQVPGDGQDDGANEPEEPADQLALETFLSLSDNSAKTMDAAYIDVHCDGCGYAVDRLIDFIRAECSLRPSACDSSFQTLLASDRTNEEITYDEGLAGLPSGSTLLAALQSMKAGESLARQPPAEVDADPDADNAKAPPQRSFDAAADALTYLRGRGFADASWAEVLNAGATVGVKPDIEPLGAWFGLIASGDVVIAGCDDACMEKVQGVVNGETRMIEDVEAVLALK